MSTKDDTNGQLNACREMTPTEQIFSNIKSFFVRLRKKLPYLIWYNDELDVCVTFHEDKLRQDDPLRSLFGGHLHQAEKLLNEVGIEFDHGIGFRGRDWEWDWSLRGPISIKFRNKAKKPELRKAVYKQKKDTAP